MYCVVLQYKMKSKWTLSKERTNILQSVMKDSQIANKIIKSPPRSIIKKTDDHLRNVALCEIASVLFFFLTEAEYEPHAADSLSKI